MRIEKAIKFNRATMIICYDREWSVLEAICSRDEIMCICSANLPIDSERAKSGRALLARIQQVNGDYENKGESVYHVDIKLDFTLPKS